MKELKEEIQILNKSLAAKDKELEKLNEALLSKEQELKAKSEVNGKSLEPKESTLDDGKEEGASTLSTKKPEVLKSALCSEVEHDEDSDLVKKITGKRVTFKEEEEKPQKQAKKRTPRKSRVPRQTYAPVKNPDEIESDSSSDEAFEPPSRKRAKPTTPIKSKLSPSQQRSKESLLKFLTKASTMGQPVGSRKNKSLSTSAQTGDEDEFDVIT